MIEWLSNTHQPYWNKQISKPSSSNVAICLYYALQSHTLMQDICNIFFKTLFYFPESSFLIKFLHTSIKTTKFKVFKLHLSDNLENSNFASFSNLHFRLRLIYRSYFYKKLKWIWIINVFTFSKIFCYCLFKYLVLCFDQFWSSWSF